MQIQSSKFANLGRPTVTEQATRARVNPNQIPPNQDSYSPGGQVEWAPAQRAQLAQVVFGGGGNEEQLRKIGKLVRELGTGGTFRREALQNISPNMFGLPQNIKHLPTLPNIFSFLSKKHVGNLFYSNNPEKITKPNVRLSQGTIPAGKTRVMAHHFNATNESLRLQTAFKNNGDKPVELTLHREGKDVKHVGWAGDIGIAAYKGYLKEKAAEKHQIAPGESYFLDQGLMEVGRRPHTGGEIRDQAVSSVALVSTDGPLSVTTSATSPSFDPSEDKLESLPLELSKKHPEKAPRKHRGTGNYPYPDRHNLGVVPMGQNEVYQLEIGPKTETGGLTFDGEYGQERRYSLLVGPDAKPGQRLAILAWAGGNDPVGVRPLGEKEEVMRVIGKPSSSNQVGVVFEGEVKAGQVLDFTQMIQGGASTPVRFIMVPIPAEAARK